MAQSNPRTVRNGLLALTTAVAVAGPAAIAHAQILGRAGSKPATKPAAPRAAEGDVKFVPKAVPVNPNDAVAVVNGEPITRAQLADEAIARKGEEILETIIARRLIEQKIRERKIEVTAAEIDAEIDKVAQNMAGMDRQGWLLTLNKERGISPTQYRRDIIYPALALRKLATPRVTVSNEDIQRAFESKYGDKLMVRMIVVGSLREANEIWSELKRAPAGFERIAMHRSRDEATRAMGGAFNRPLSRHETPATLSDAAFKQLVDGNPDDKDPATGKPIVPKDGDITGPIQITETSYILLRREKSIPAMNVNKNDPIVLKELNALMYEALVNQEMERILQEMHDTAKVENMLTGRVNTVRKDEVVEVPPIDGEVKQMSQDPKLGMRALPVPKTATEQQDATRSRRSSNPIGVSEADRKSAESIRKNMEAPGSTPPGN